MTEHVSAAAQAALENGLGVKLWRRLRLYDLGNLCRRQVAGPSLAAVNLHSMLVIVDFAARAAARSTGPGAALLLELKQQRRDAADVAPVGLVVGLDDEQARNRHAPRAVARVNGTRSVRTKRPMHERQKLRRDQPPFRSRRVLVRLRMIEMNLGDAAGRDVL